MSVFDSFSMREFRFARHCRTAIDLIDANETEQAAARLRKAEQLLKLGDTMWTSEVALIYADYLHHYDDAQRVLKPLVEARDPAGIMQASETYLSSREYSDAVRVLKVASDVPDPRTAKASQHLGLAFLEEEQYDESARWYETASAAGDPLNLGLAVATRLMAMNVNQPTKLSADEISELKRMGKASRTIASHKDTAEVAAQLLMVELGLKAWSDQAEYWLSKDVPATDLHSIMLGLHGSADFYLHHQRWDSATACYAKAHDIATYIRRNLPASGEYRQVLVAGCLNVLASEARTAILLDQWENWKEAMEEASAFEALCQGNHPLLIHARAAVSSTRMSGVFALIKSGATTLYDVDELWADNCPHLTAAVEAIELADTGSNPPLAERRAHLLASIIVASSQRSTINDEALDAITTAVQRLTPQIVHCGEDEARELEIPLRLGATLVEQHRPGTGSRMREDGKTWPE